MHKVGAKGTYVGQMTWLGILFFASPRLGSKVLISVCWLGNYYLYSSGGARGGLGGYSPPSERASPPVGMRKAIFSEIFGIYSTLETIF